MFGYNGFNRGYAIGSSFGGGYENVSNKVYDNTYNSQQLKMVSKQEIKQIQDIELSNDTMCRVLTLAEKYALKVNKKYGAYNMSSACGEDLLRLFVREIEIFRLSYENMIEVYKEFRFPYNLTKSEILQDINNWSKYVSEENRIYYKNLYDIVNGNYKFSLKDEIRKLKEKKMENDYRDGERAINLQNHVPYISYNTQELARQAEKNYLYDNNYQPQAKLYQKPDQKMLNQLSQDVHYKNVQFSNI